MDEQQNLKTDYQDYTFVGNKKFNMINNPDGTFSFEDVTNYEIEGDDFGSNDINATNQRVNEMYVKGVYYDNTNQKLIDKNGQILNPDIPKYDNNEGTNYIQIGNLKICWGTVQVSYVNPNVMSSNLSFPVNFTNNPTVLATINGTNNVSAELDENVKVSGVGTSSCLIYVHSKNGEFSSGWQQNVNWIAVGY